MGGLVASTVARCPASSTIDDVFGRKSRLLAIVELNLAIKAVEVARADVAMPQTQF
jgi:hypothetical protein